MSAATDKMEFVHAMARHSHANINDCLRLMRYAATLQRLAVKQCNEPWKEKDQLKRQRVQGKVTQSCALLGDGTKAVFQNDPRGCVVKIVVSDGYTNDFGHEGICVPS